jgi:hypothetical protein
MYRFGIDPPGWNMPELDESGPGTSDPTPGM